MAKSIILLSGGLDSAVALGYCKDTYNIELALTFDYGQKALNNELKASENLAKHYHIEHKVIHLDWLKDITNTALVSSNDIPSKNFCTNESAKSVWVPNRNSLFLNIAACFADSYSYEYIIYGANKDEALTFPDNTEAFRQTISDLFKNSTLVKPKVIAPLINYSKGDIVRIALEKSIPLEFVRSCYNNYEHNCGKCESCYHLLKALKENNAEKYINILFDNYEN